MMEVRKASWKIWRRFHNAITKSRPKAEASTMVSKSITICSVQGIIPTKAKVHSKSVDSIPGTIYSHLLLNAYSRWLQVPICRYSCRAQRLSIRTLLIQSLIRISPAQTSNRASSRLRHTEESLSETQSASLSLTLIAILRSILKPVEVSLGSFPCFDSKYEHEDSSE